jgi:chromosomal replication initiation ATPase DnaA
VTTQPSPFVHVVLDRDELQGIADEVGAMEHAIALYDRHAALRHEMRRRNLTLIERASTMREIAAAVAPNFGCDVAELRGRGHRVRLALARGCFIFAAYEHHLRISGDRRWSLPALGRFLSGRDHTTALHLLRKAHAALDAALAELGLRP